MLALQALITVVVIAVALITLICFVFGPSIKNGCKTVSDRLEHEEKVAEEHRKSEKEAQRLKEISFREAREEVEKMSLRIGQKGDPNCP